MSELVKEVKKYVTSNGKEFDEKSDAASYEYISQIVKKISEALGETGYSILWRKIIEKRKELIKVLNQIEDFDVRGLDLYFS